MDEIYLAGEADTLACGRRLAARLSGNELIFLHGDLGAGKTTLVRGIIEGLGHRGHVRSPTYTLLESYEISGLCVYHFDFYRIEDPGELAYIGVDELLGERALKLVEWPVKGMGRLPAPDVEIHLRLAGAGRMLRYERHDAR